MAPPSPLQLPALDLEERDLEDFGDREEDTVAMALEIAADEHLTFMPQTTESVFTQALDPLPTAETYLDGYQALNARNFEEHDLEAFDETKEEIVATAMEIVTDEHITFTPQTAYKPSNNRQEYQNARRQGFQPGWWASQATSHLASSQKQHLYQATTSSLIHNSFNSRSFDGPLGLSPAKLDALIAIFPSTNPKGGLTVREYQSIAQTGGRNAETGCRNAETEGREAKTTEVLLCSYNHSNVEYRIQL
ncbi:hypothetical protein B0H65DRAFT_573666 [Neurospora tetraspora]|uniref:Uncharacterized protein n=1 Tax=Neurospora tetraspora TaxID=94610 RepID=A0AAE0JEW5_9PEZI|nr:hypothetical protein B0H65DRAFT_573666 [Neurospora tetraspora]